MRIPRPTDPGTGAGQFVRFLGIGGVNTAVYYGVFRLADARLHYLAAYFVAFAAAVVVSFLLNCRFTYRIRPTWRGALRFPASSLFNLVAGAAVLQLGVSVFGLPHGIAALLGGVLVTPLTFLLSRWALVPGSGPGPQGSVEDGVIESTPK